MLLNEDEQRDKYRKHVSPTRQVNLCLTSRIGTTIKMRFFLFGMAPETARGSSSEAEAKSVEQPYVLQRWIRKSPEPYQPPSQLRKEHLQRVHDTSSIGTGCWSYYILETLGCGSNMR